MGTTSTNAAPPETPPDYPDQRSLRDALYCRTAGLPRRSGPDVRIRVDLLIAGRSPHCDTCDRRLGRGGSCPGVVCRNPTIRPVCHNRLGDHMEEL